MSKHCHQDDDYVQELIQQAARAGITPYEMVAKPLSVQERASKERQLTQAASLLALGDGDQAFIDHAAAVQMTPAQFHEKLERRKEMLTDELVNNVTRATVPSAAFFDLVTERFAEADRTADAALHTIRRQRGWLVATAAALAVLVIACGYLFTSGQRLPTLAATATEPATQTAPKRAAWPTEPAPASPDDAALTALPYPANGTILQHNSKERVAPLSVKTEADTAYLVKLVDRNDQTVISFFAGPNATTDVYVPLGSYVLKYACGNGAWYGATSLFGAETQCFQAEDRFLFTEDSEGYNGYTVTLYQIPNGNLETTEIPAENF